MKAFGLADENAAATMIEVSTPEAGPGEVPVRVRASSVNGYDVFVASGMARGASVPGHRQEGFRRRDRLGWRRSHSLRR